MTALPKEHEAKPAKRSVRRILLPNSTPVPNFFFDDILAEDEIPHAIRSVLFFLLRQTVGWDKRSDDVSFTQIEARASVSRHTAIHAVRVICDLWGLFRIGRGGHGTWNSYTIAGLSKDEFYARCQAVACIYDTICPTATQLREKPCSEAKIVAEMARIKNSE